MSTSAPQSGTIRPTDDEARALARSLIDRARFAALAVLVEGRPMVSRVAFATAPDGAPISLVSDLALHTRALRSAPQCSLLVGEPGVRGDPLTHPRLTLQCSAGFTGHDNPQFPALRDHYLTVQPKAKLYVDFADFSFVIFTIEKAFLNGGFGRAFILEAGDLTKKGAP